MSGDQLSDDESSHNQLTGGRKVHDGVSLDEYSRHLLHVLVGVFSLFSPSVGWKTDSFKDLISVKPTSHTVRHLLEISFVFLVRHFKDDGFVELLMELWSAEGWLATTQDPLFADEPVFRDRRAAFLAACLSRHKNWAYIHSNSPKLASPARSSLSSRHRQPRSASGSCGFSDHRGQG